MSFRKQRAEAPPTAKRLAKALRSGLELRWSIPAPSPDSPNPFPPKGNVRPFLEPYADGLNYPLWCHRNPLLRCLWVLRRLVRKIISPWLHVQTHFNLSAMSVIEQVEQRVKSLEEVALTLRHTVETLEKSLLARINQEPERDVDTLEAGILARVNRELGWQGKIAEAGLWFNPPVIVHLDKKGPQVAGITERILEHIYVHTHLPRPPARLLDLGCSESTNAIEMASLGFEVVGVDLRCLPLSHPNFTMVQANLADMPFEDESFDVAVALSTIEHVGLGWYTEEERGSSDEQVIAEVLRLLKPGGRFIVTTPFGRRTVTPVHRIYDRARLDQMLHGFRVVDKGYGIRDGDAWFHTLDERRAEQVDGAERVSAVCLMVLEKP
jgi:SAM-dependent methyltransferase